MNFSAADHAFMSQALRLAELGLYSTDPNPRVGCVIVKDGTVIGEGWHRRAGGPHAEVHALRQAGERARGATVYVTLEPCSHHGRTPPCADALVAARVGRVVTAVVDPNPKVSGLGLEKLTHAGIQAESGLLQCQAEALNAGFFRRMQTGLPWVRVKLAMSLDGRTAPARMPVEGKTHWITGPQARLDVHRLRARSSVVLTGIGTVLADDPLLNVRLPDTAELQQPDLAILDSRMRIGAQARCLHAEQRRIWIYTALQTPTNKAGAQTVVVERDDQGLALKSILKHLAEQGANEVMVEAGPRLSGAMWRAQLAQELIVYVAPLLLGEHGLPLLALAGMSGETAPRCDLQWQDQRRIGDDWRFTLIRKQPE